MPVPAHKNSGKHKDLTIVGRAASGDVAGASFLGRVMRPVTPTNASAITAACKDVAGHKCALHTNYCDAA